MNWKYIMVSLLVYVYLLVFFLFNLSWMMIKTNSMFEINNKISIKNSKFVLHNLESYPIIQGNLKKFNPVFVLVICVFVCVILFQQMKLLP